LFWYEFMLVGTNSVSSTRKFVPFDDVSVTTQ